MQNVHAVTSSGVGGGSLIYFNITEKPASIVYKNWSTQKSGIPLDKTYTYKYIYGPDDALSYVDNPADIENKIDYLDVASNFIGTNTITTTAGLGKFKLPRSRAFQDAANNIQGAIQARGVNLSITDVPNGLFMVQRGTVQSPTVPKVNKYSKESNACQRQGRLD
jgi:hypothetical protein